MTIMCPQFLQMYGTLININCQPVKEMQASSMAKRAIKSAVLNAEKDWKK